MKKLLLGVVTLLTAEFANADHHVAPVLGAIVGATVGHEIGHHSPVSTVAGAVVGAVVGHELGHHSRREVVHYYEPPPQRVVVHHVDRHVVYPYVERREVVYYQKDRGRHGRHHKAHHRGHH